MRVKIGTVSRKLIAKECGDEDMSSLRKKSLGFCKILKSLEQANKTKVKKKMKTLFFRY